MRHRSWALTRHRGGDDCSDLFRRFDMVHIGADRTGQRGDVRPRGFAELDRYLFRQAGQDVRRQIARVFVCTAGDADAVLGFYTLSALSIDLASLPEALSRKLPRHPVPCALIGRLAVDTSVHGHGLGSLLLADAVRRVAAAGETVAMHALIVDASNEGAKRFCEGFSFAPLRDRPMRLFLPLGHSGMREPERPTQT